MRRLYLAAVLHALVMVVPVWPQRAAAAATGLPRAAQGLSVSVMIGRTCERYAAAILREYDAWRFAQHAALSAALSHQMRRLPLAHLQPCEQVLELVVRKDGALPYLTPLLDHGYRLARISTPANTQRHLALSRAVQRGLLSRQPPMGTALVRALSGVGYRPYSANAGYVATALAFSRFGRAQFAKGASPEHLLRLSEMYRNCLQITTATATALSDDARRRCALLVEEVAAALPGGGQGPSGPDLVDVASGGISRGVAACYAGANPGADIIARFEEYNECRRDEQRRQARGSGVSPNGLAYPTASGAAPVSAPARMQDLLAGATPVGRPEHDDGASTQGFWEMDTTHYQRGEDQITVQEYSQRTAGEPTRTGTTITVENAAGTSTYQYEGLEGGDQQLRGMTYESSDGRYSYSCEIHEDGSKTEVAIDRETGEVAKIETDKDGNQQVSECTLGSDGACRAQTASQPVDEVLPQACQFGTRPDKQKASAAGRRDLGPWILPHPDSAPAGAVDACLAAFANDPPAACPPSVAMCIDPPPPGSCGCGGSQGGGSPLPGSGSGFCAVVNCGADGSCNAKTGSCTTGAGAVFPGTPHPPRPDIRSGPIHYGPLSSSRRMLPNPEKLWYPSASQRGLAQLFGTRPSAERPR
jgi:uncharacterized membrane protein YkoI